MRNIIEYPVTKQEIVDCLDHLIQKNDYEVAARRIIGDMTSLILQEAKKIVERSPDI